MPDSVTGDNTSQVSYDLIVEVSVDDDAEIPPLSQSLEPQIRAAAVAALDRKQCHRGEVQIRISNDATIHQINRQFLDHDYPTDVISFGYECEPPQVSGDVVVSVETAERQAESHGASVVEELLLYVVHGCLH
ncbi:MAG: rRNA maturation RNase YbeY, partial [Planctomycetota bacterium]